MEKKPLKRLAALKPYSIDHHQGLLLCWKIRTGIKNSIDITRIAKYVQWFYENELLPHFKLEEEYIFPTLGPDNSLITQAVKEHRAITSLAEGHKDEKSLAELAELLEKHIRFEERVLFQEIQQHATSEELAEIERVHSAEKFVENKNDEFWLYQRKNQAN